MSAARRTPWWALASAALAPVALIGGWTAAAARQDGGFDPVAQTISALAATDADDRWLMTGGFVVVGCCHVVTALGLRSARPAGRWVLAGGGVGVLAVAALPEPMPAHVPAATAAFAALSVWPALAAAPDRRTGLVVGGILTAGLIGFGLSLDGARVGLVERLLAGAQVLWPLAVAVRGRRTGGWV